MVGLSIRRFVTKAEDTSTNVEIKVHAQYVTLSIYVNLR